MSGKIERIELYHVDVPLPSPLFPVWIPGYAQYRNSYTLLAVTTRDGLTGYATGVAFEREREGLGDFIGRFLLGLDPYDVDEASERLRQSSFLGWRNSWMETAFWDLAAKAQQIPLHQLLADRLAAKLGTSPQPPARVVETYASFWESRSPKVRAEAIERVQRMGFKGAKVNMRARDMSEDLEKLRVAREVAGPGFQLMAHARQAWTVSLVDKAPVWDLARAREFAERAEPYELRWIQEPLPSDAWEDLAELARSSKTPIAGGDITITFIPLKALIKQGCYSILTPDAAFAGLAAVLRTMKLCQERGLAFSPSSGSDGLGLAANVHALVAWLSVGGAPDSPVEFAWEPPALIPELRDVLLKEPLTIRQDGMLPVPVGPGLGVEVDHKALRRYGTRFHTLTPVRFVVSSARRAGLRQTVELSSQGARRRERVRT